MRALVTTCTTTVRALRNRMLQFPFPLQSQKLHVNQVRSFFSRLSLLRANDFFSTTIAASLSDPRSPSSSKPSNNNTCGDFSHIDFTGLAQTVILRCSHFLDRQKGKDFPNASLKDLLLDISNIIPDTARKFFRVSVLRPEDVLEILLRFKSESREVGIEARKVESLWQIFKWAKGQDKGFKHLPLSGEVMASLLVRVGMLEEAELLLYTIESPGISLDSHEIFSDLIEGYVGDGQLERAILVYDRMRERGLEPSMKCRRVLLDLLVQKKKIQLASRVCGDMIEMNANFSNVDESSFENVIRLLCRDGKIQEGRNLVKKALVSGLRPSCLVINEIARGYCEKNELHDLMTFFVDTECPPTMAAGNKVIHHVCCYFGTEKADLFLQELKDLGFNPDEKTFGILIGWSCRERKLKNAFVYLSEMLSKCMRPHVFSYNALLSAVFKEGMWKHAQDILDEMVDQGTPPDKSTFRVLLAGFCKARQFEEVKRIVCEMASHGFVRLSSVEDPLSKAFMVLGFNPLAVRLKRDNHVGYSKTEFFDNLGNGLYLDTDLDEYEKMVTRVLEDSMIPDFNLIVMEQCSHGNFRMALGLCNEMDQWGQDPSLSVVSMLVERLCSSCSHIKAITKLLKKMPELPNQLDQEILNLLVQAYSKKGLTESGKIILDQMLQQNLIVKNETYTALMMSLCKKGNLKDLHGYWEIAKRKKWLPELEDCEALVECLCQRAMLEEALQLLESRLFYNPNSGSNVFSFFLEKLCATGFTGAAHVLLDELLNRGCVLDRITYSHVIKGLCKEQKFSVAFAILDTMLAENLAPCLDVSVLLIPQLCKAGRCEDAVALKEIGSREHSSDSFSLHRALLKGFCVTGKIQEAATLFQDMLLKGLVLDAEICNILIQGHCQLKNLRRVGDLLGVLIKENLSLSISSYRHLVYLMFSKGRVLCALNLKELMLGQSKSNDLIVYNILIFSLFEMRSSSLVKKIVDELQEKDLQPSEITYNFLVYGFSQCKDVLSAAEYLYSMISKELRPSNRCLRALITSQCNVGELGKALQLSREMELRGWVHSSIIQNAIVEGLLSRGKLQEAEDLLDRLVEKCLIPDSINYDNLIKRFSCYGRLNKAVDLLNIMLKKGNVPNSTSYDSVIQGFCNWNRLDEAMIFFSEMLYRDLKPSINTSGMLIHAFCQNWRTAEAENILTSMLQVGENPSRETYCAVINSYRSVNNLKKASELIQMMQQRGYEPDFETHWSLISNLSNSNDSNQGFLSRLLSASGFAGKRVSKTKMG